MVSIIVTVLTYTFFRNMESGVLKHNFIEISTSLVADTVKSLEDKAMSARALSTMYAGILGTTAGGSTMAYSTNATGDGRSSGTPSANHSPLVMLSPSAAACAADPILASWPNVTLPGFDAIASAMLGVTGSCAAIFAPLLRDDNASATWEQYATDNALSPVRAVVSDGIRNGVMDGRRVQKELAEENFDVDAALPAATTGNSGEDQALHENRDMLFDHSSSASSSSSLRFPAWQIAPVQLMNEGIMRDYYSHPPYKAAIDRLLKWEEERGQHGEEMSDDSQGRSIKPHTPVAATALVPCEEMLLPLHLTAVPKKTRIKLSGADYDTSHGLHRRSRYLEHDVREQPLTENDGLCSAIFHPVYDALPSSESDHAPTMSGVVAEVFSWTNILKNIVNGHGPHKIRVVISSNLKLLDGSGVRSSVASYEVTESGASYIDNARIIDDHHLDMMQSYDFSFEMDDDMTYTFEMYPEDIRWTDLSKRPMFLSIIAACFFFLSVMVFFVYDYFVK